MPWWKMVDLSLDSAKIFGATRILEKPFSQKLMVSAVHELLDIISDKSPYMENGDSAELKKEQGRQQSGGDNQ